MQYLPVAVLVHGASLVCKRWNKLCRNDSLWEWRYHNINQPPKPVCCTNDRSTMCWPDMQQGDITEGNTPTDFMSEVLAQREKGTGTFERMKPHKDSEAEEEEEDRPMKKPKRVSQTAGRKDIKRESERNGKSKLAKQQLAEAPPPSAHFVAKKTDSDFWKQMYIFCYKECIRLHRCARSHVHDSVGFMRRALRRFFRALNFTIPVDPVREVACKPQLMPPCSETRCRAQRLQIGRAHV